MTLTHTLLLIWFLHTLFLLIFVLMRTFCRTLWRSLWGPHELMRTWRHYQCCAKHLNLTLTLLSLLVFQINVFGGKVGTGPHKVSKRSDIALIVETRGPHQSMKTFSHAEVKVYGFASVLHGRNVLPQGKLAVNCKSCHVWTNLQAANWEVKCVCVCERVEGNE